MTNGRHITVHKITGNTFFGKAYRLRTMYFHILKSFVVEAGLKKFFALAGKDEDIGLEGIIVSFWAVVHINIGEIDSSIGKKPFAVFQPDDCSCWSCYRYAAYAGDVSAQVEYGDGVVDAVHGDGPNCFHITNGV